MQVAPLHRRTKNRAQHIVDVIDGPRCVSRLREMSHVCLNLLSCDVRERLVAETWQQVRLLLYGLSVLAFVLVWRALHRLWTVKLLIASDHVLNQSALFRWVRHPNYFLNILPELCGLALIMGAWIVLVLGLPCYLLVLRVRIKQEEEVMQQRFPHYATRPVPPRARDTTLERPST